MPCSFLLYNNVNQLFVHIYLVHIYVHSCMYTWASLTLIPLPAPLGHHGAPSRARCAMGSIPLTVLYMAVCIHQCYPLLPPVCPQVHSLYLRLYHCHQHHLSRFSLYIYVNIILVFLTFSMTDSGFIHITYSQFRENNHLEWPDCTAGHWLGASTLPRMPCVLYHFIFLTTCSLHTLTSKGI